MRYLLMIYAEEATAPTEGSRESQEMFAEYYAFTNRITEEGINAGGAALQPTATATTVRVRDGEVITTDGPFAETKEQLGGFYIVDCADLDQALAAAAAIPDARRGSIEVRPVWEIPEDASG